MRCSPSVPMKRPRPELRLVVPVEPKWFEIGLRQVHPWRDQTSARRLTLLFDCGCKTAVGFFCSERHWCKPEHFDALIVFIEPQAMTGLLSMPNSLWMPAAHA